MTKKKSMTAGQRQAAMEKQVQQLTFATQIGQQMTQRFGQQLDVIQRDLASIATRQRDLQYRLLAYQELSGSDIDMVNKKAEDLQIKDFEEFSAKDDETNNLSVADVVVEDSVIIFTTTAEDNKGYLRSKQALEDLAFPQMRDDLLGKKVGDSIDIDINGVTHKLTLLGIRSKPAEEVSDEQQEDGQAVG